MSWFIKYWRSLLIVFFIVVGSCSLCYLLGHRSGKITGANEVKALWDKENKAREHAVKEIEEGLLALSYFFNDLALSAQAENEIQKEIVFKEVIKYVEKDNAPADIVDNDWVSIYNKSIRRAD